MENINHKDIKNNKKPGSHHEFFKQSQNLSDKGQTAPSNKWKIKTKGTDIPKEFDSFSDLAKVKNFLPHSQFVFDNLVKLNYRTPTPIQSIALPLIFNKRDLFGLAPTGTGKTAAFMVPAVHFANERNRKKTKAKMRKTAKPSVLIVVPTRELSRQTAEFARSLCENSEPILPLLQAGETNFGSERHREGGILISTPLQLFSDLKGKRVKLRSVRYLVLDEADRLLDTADERKSKLKAKLKLRKFEKLNKSQKSKKSADFKKNVKSLVKFEEPEHRTVSASEQIDFILSKCTNKKLQRCLFSATLPSHIETLARTVLRDPVRVSIGPREASSLSVKQSLVFVGSDNFKLFALKQMFDKEFTSPVLIFTQTKSRAKYLCENLLPYGFKVDYISSNKTKIQRDQTLDQFRSEEIDILVCTDLVARGIDFQKIAMVVNFDFPSSATEYVHRVGRSGRAGLCGRAVTFFTENDRVLLRRIADVVAQSGGEVPEWILNSKKVSRSRRIKVKFMPPKRKKISPLKVDI